MAEGGRFFDQHGAVHAALGRIAAQLDRLGVDYAVVGGLALFHHGYRRFTEDIDLLVTADGLALIHEKLRGRGWLPLFEGSRNLRDTASGVRVEFLVTGGFPGDGRPKPVAFPDPADCRETSDGVAWLTIDKLVELKLASGLSKADRLKDLADVLEIIRTLGLSRDLSERLDASVRDKYCELWDAAHEGD